MTTMLDTVDPQSGLPEFLRRRQPNYAQAPTGLLSQAAYQAAGPFPSYNPKPMTIAPPLAPVKSPTAGATGSDGGGAAAGLGGLLGLAAQNPSAVSSLYNSARGLFGGAPESLATALSPSASAPAMMTPNFGMPGLAPGVDAAISAAGTGTPSLASLLSPSASAPAMISPTITPPALGPGVDAAISQSAATGGVPWGTVAGGAALLGGGLLAADGISRGREGQAALGGGIAAAGAGSLAGLSGLAALGPVGLLGAGVGALASSLVNTKEFGDVALRNYWAGVDQGRGIGQSDPTELAQGFVNFYRTNKNEFAPQSVYGRTGNEDFLYDMTQKINSAVQSGAVPPDATPDQIYAQVVQPWMATMGEGPKDEKARAIQDFMMMDIINSYQKGQPISNAQVKNDSKFRIVSERPVYPGATLAPPVMPTMNQGLLGGTY